MGENEKRTLTREYGKKEVEKNIKKYIIAPGYVRARDGDIHFISAERLVQLYRVNIRECIIFHDKTSLRGYKAAYIEELTWLRPREDGNYQLAIEASARA